MEAVWIALGGNVAFLAVVAFLGKVRHNALAEQRHREVQATA